MLDSSQNDILKQVNELLHQAEEEEHKYNWNNAIELLKKAERISLDKELKEIESKIYYKLGEIYVIAADFEKTEENVLNCYHLSILNFQKAHIIFKKKEIEGRLNASLGFINLLKYLIDSEAGKEEILLETARNCYKKAKLIYKEKGNLIDSLIMEILESRALDYLIGEKLIRIDESSDFKELVSKHENLMARIWNKIKKQQHFSEIYLYIFLENILLFSEWVFTYLPVENSRKKQYIIDNQDVIKEFIEIFGKSIKTLNQFLAYTIYSLLNTLFSIFFVDNQFEQKTHLKKAQKWLKKGEILLPKINSNVSLFIFYFTRLTTAIFLIYLGFSTKDFRYVMEDLNLCVDLISLYHPKIVAAHIFLVAGSILLTGALNRSTPDIQRINFAKKTSDLNDLLVNRAPIVNNPTYEILYLNRYVGLCLIHSILGDIIKDKNERSGHLEMAFEIFNKISEYEEQKIYYNYFYLVGVSRVGILLAENTSNKRKKITYYKKVINILLISKKTTIAFFHIENLFLIGSVYYKLSKLTNDDGILKKSYSSYMEAIEYFKNKGYFNLVGSAYINLAQIEDRLGNFLSAAENYKKSIHSFDKAILTLTYSRAGKKIEKLKNYVEAWNLIEVAKSYHVKEDHYNAQINYEQASNILKELREYKFESPYYSAWAILENAENLSKQNKHQEAAETYLISKNNFKDATEILNSYLEKRRSPEDLDRLSKLIQVANIRETYCIARYQIEIARLESKKGNHLEAAELYSKASSLFENLCQLYEIKREKEELMAIFYLCKAWENMERADIEHKPTLYATASDLFKKAGNIFPESRMKLLSIGNSLYCSALECGSLFDSSINLEEKIDFYRKIKMNLRESSKNYQLGGFEQDAQWALATSTYFDGVWHLIQSDYEIDHSKKSQYLSIATNYLNNALDIFGKAGYKQRREEILNYLKMIKDEKAILTSALNLIERPAISASSIGISAPSCPIEISSSVNIEEMQRTDLQTESEINWHKRIHHIYLFMPNGTCIYDHPFKPEEEIEPQLVAGGLTGISGLIQEITKNRTKIKIVEQEEMTILLEYGKYLNIALITEENLITLRNKLTKLIEEVEDFYQEELERYSGNLTPFSKVGKFIQKIFEK